MANPLELWTGNRWMRSPMREFSRFENTFDRLFNEVMSLKGDKSDLQFDFSPSCEILEEDKQFVLKFDLPGVPKDHVQVSVDGDLLTVKAERKEEMKKDEQKRHLSEIHYGSYVRSFTLPEPIDEAKVDAKFENGVLTVCVPRTPQKQNKATKQIAIH